MYVQADLELAIEFGIECSTCTGTCCDILGAYSDDKLAEDEGSARRTEEEGGRSEGRKEERKERRKEEKREGGREGVAPLLKSRDPHLARWGINCTHCMDWQHEDITFTRCR